MHSSSLVSFLLFKIKLERMRVVASGSSRFPEKQQTNLDNYEETAENELFSNTPATCEISASDLLFQNPLVQLYHVHVIEHGLEKKVAIRKVITG
jgi:hypothetical protein